MFLGIIEEEGEWRIKELGVVNDHTEMGLSRYCRADSCMNNSS